MAPSLQWRITGRSSVNSHKKFSVKCLNNWIEKILHLTAVRTNQISSLGRMWNCLNLWTHQQPWHFTVPPVTRVPHFYNLWNPLMYQQWMTAYVAVRENSWQLTSGYNAQFKPKRSKQMADAGQHPLSDLDRWSGSSLEISAWSPRP